MQLDVCVDSETVRARSQIDWRESLVSPLLFAMIYVGQSWQALDFRVVSL